MNDKSNKLGFEQDIVRLPGQSLDEQLSDFLEEKVDSYLLMLVISLLLIIFSTIVWFTRPINPIIIILGSIPHIGYALYKLRGARKHTSNLRRGRDGERYVGQLLEQIRVDSQIVFHDIVGPSFNLDHVVIGPNGIYVIETKTWSKGGNGGEISYDGKDFILNGNILAKNPVQQVQSAARWLSNLLRESTGKAFSVKSVIALPSWFIKPEFNKAMQNENVLIVNPKNIGKFLKNRKETLSDEEIHLASYHLSLYLKAKNAIENNK